VSRAGETYVVRRVVRKKPAHGGHSGGSWKVAYADFVTAMMALFLMLWLLSAVPKETLDGLAVYFSDAQFDIMPPGATLMSQDGPASRPDLIGRTPAASPAYGEDGDPAADLREEAAGESAPNVWWALPNQFQSMDEETERAIELARFDHAKAAILHAIEDSDELEKLKESLIIDRTPEGLRIQILDRDRYAMFPVGSEAMYPHTRSLLSIVAKAVADMPNKLSIRGHTDSLPYAAGAAYDNWRLSSDRANATRAALVDEGLARERLAEVVGKADADHLFPNQPLDPRNRRISIVLLNLHTPPATPLQE
jgi:chemotaxis protein MotB